MTQRIRWIALLGVFFLAAMPGLAGDDITLEGAFVWERNEDNKEGDLKAIFTPTGEGEWSVAFHFDWEDEPHIYTGTCTGSLDGELSGDVKADGDREMNFTFKGTFENGMFSGTHNFVTDEGIKKAGTLTLSKSKG